ncbi:MAG: hypothetical protein A3G76_02525 [Acidobacteria bacterium RIFCSPLOWO2_12_FULL_65_11]|nr:MAG: hypothetical protein A3H95_14825 [Acidobacteria bacterium RIFCSPLOWO2_02_FULL_64_15]OFW34059.1 MAG: hypothetical protein A3G76_02525 [Acidobacteria bacterium RIFCSPLOWO2_12_FULL_65_11]
MAAITSFRDLLLWQKSMSLAERCYQVSRRFRREDQLATGTVFLRDVRTASLSAQRRRGARPRTVKPFSVCS